MTTLERINQLTDREAIALYERVSRELLTGIPDAGKIEDQTSEKFHLDQDVLQEVEIPSEYALPLVKESLQRWAKDPALSPVLDNFLDNPVQTMGVTIILSLGALLITTIASTSIKAEYKDGKWYFSYTTANISDNAVKIVNKFLGMLPDHLKQLGSIK